jgi:hypothetical protein
LLRIWFNLHHSHINIIWFLWFRFVRYGGRSSSVQCLGNFLSKIFTWQFTIKDPCSSPQDSP